MAAAVITMQHRGRRPSLGCMGTGRCHRPCLRTAIQWARHWHRLDPTTQVVAQDVFDRLANAAGTELTSRILVAERASELADRALAMWDVHAQRNENALALFARTPQLRVAAMEPREPATRPPPQSHHYEGAPGVAAPAR